MSIEDIVLSGESLNRLAESVDELVTGTDSLRDINRRLSESMLDLPFAYVGYLRDYRFRVPKEKSPYHSCKVECFGGLWLACRATSEEWDSFLATMPDELRGEGFSPSVVNNRLVMVQRNPEDERTVPMMMLDVGRSAYDPAGKPLYVGAKVYIRKLRTVAMVTALEDATSERIALVLSSGDQDIRFANDVSRIDVL